MEDKKTELSVSTEVLEKMAEIAAKEVDGVTGLSKKAVQGNMDDDPMLRIEDFLEQSLYENANAQDQHKFHFFCDLVSNRNMTSHYERIKYEVQERKLLPLAKTDDLLPHKKFVNAVKTYVDFLYKNRKENRTAEQEHNEK